MENGEYEEEGCLLHPICDISRERSLKSGPEGYKINTSLGDNLHRVICTWHYYYYYYYYYYRHYWLHTDTLASCAAVKYFNHPVAGAHFK